MTTTTPPVNFFDMKNEIFIEICKQHQSKDNMHVVHRTKDTERAEQAYSFENLE